MTDPIQIRHDGQWGNTEAEPPWEDREDSPITTWGDPDGIHGLLEVYAHEGAAWLVRWTREDAGVAFIAATDRDLIAIISEILPLLQASLVVDVIAGIMSELMDANGFVDELIAGALTRFSGERDELKWRQEAIRARLKASRKAALQSTPAAPTEAR